MFTPGVAVCSQWSDTTNKMATVTAINHKEFLSSTLWNFKENDILCDVTLEVEGHQVKGHKVILAANCQYFQDLFSGNSEQSGYHTCQGTSYQCAAQLIKYMYTGNWDSVDCDLEQLKSTAQKWRMSCLEYLLQGDDPGEVTIGPGTKETDIKKEEGEEEGYDTDTYSYHEQSYSSETVKDEDTSQYHDRRDNDLSHGRRKRRLHKAKTKNKNLKAALNQNRSVKKVLQVHDKEECVSCSHYVLPGTLQAHKRVCIQQRSEDKNFLPCDKCDESFPGWRQLNAHMRNAHRIGGEPTKYLNAHKHWACDECPKTYAGWKILINHRFRYHGKSNEGLNVFKCKVSITSPSVFCKKLGVGGDI